MLIRAVIFDMDGTIIKSHAVWYEINVSFVGKDNVGLFLDLRKRAPGIGIEKICNVLKSEFNMPGTIAQIAQIYQTRAQDFFTKSPIDFIPGFHDFHQHLREENIATGLATDAPSYVLDVIKTKLGLASFFDDHIYNSCLVGNVFKPNPAVFQYTLDRLNIAPENCIVFEDSYEGVTAAKNLGLFCVGVVRNDNVGEVAHADFIIDDYKDLRLSLLQSKKLLASKPIDFAQQAG